MLSRFKSVLTAAALIWAALAVPSHASVLYTFGNLTGGATSGSLELNLSSLTAASNLNGDISPYLIALNFTENGQSFTITPANLAAGSYINTGAAGSGGAGVIFTLTAEQNFSAPTPTLEIFTNSWQVHSGLNGATIAQGSFSIGAPVVISAAVPEASTWVMMILGFAAVGYLAHRSRRRTTSLATA
jgi:hypothetical protein